MTKIHLGERFVFLRYLYLIINVQYLKIKVKDLRFTEIYHLNLLILSLFLLYLQQQKKNHEETHLLDNRNYPHGLCLQ